MIRIGDGLLELVIAAAAIEYDTPNFVYGACREIEAF